MSGILVIGEVQDGAIAPVSAELLAAARKLADEGVGGGISLAVMGDDLSGVSAAQAPGADSIVLISNPALKDGGTGGYDAPVLAVAALNESKSPDVILFAKTDFGAVAGPRLAFKLGVPVAQDCIDIAVDSETGRVAVTRPVFGGNALAVYGFNGDGTQIATIRPGVFDPIEGEGSGSVEEFDASEAVSEVRSTLVETVVQQSEGVRLEDADFIISGGRGLGGPEPFEQLQELADVLGGAVGASRAACDAGWVDHSYQIGLTGKSVKPTVYLSVGISGASQHMAGLSGARNIVAINKDGDANIFKSARFGVVGDWEKVLPAFTATVRDLAG
ncbi:MAG: electron transfer flavoprotein subunit alpha/FixB family protein [Chloroflexi bacterium]|jgi:electron transfer flavoprotein alpha subunit|nr:electron transfer flavoprotein subunit alpha/FixB family protein [Chloroflexota bacterium]MBT4074630.1 electron transfer flavoprotein subunit alpha/FixB family protein [Chloroflexota bacterium]MBT4514239.1 electron transfer flavoprotein subunit alpha/FixB family protein [Chloroflexota bacterium]MBT5320308.1 electron transfer flavoprotein subunit alpha/FixB family protein [Chloroflexota bacterium]MBT6681368.1 electron transfer flavoprotein subunit alpha/FixB family protein [Chloroflexota bact